MDETNERMENVNPEWNTESLQGEIYDQSAVLKAARKHFSMLGLWYFVGACVIYGLQYVLSRLIVQFKPTWLMSMNGSMIFSAVVVYLIGFPLIIMLVRKLPAEKVEKHHMTVGQFLIAAIMCFCIVYLSNILGNVITFFIGSVFRDGLLQNPLYDMISSTNIWLMFAYTVICAPILEEYVFRKLIVDRAVRYGQGVAVVLSGLMFGLFHGNLNQFAYAFTLGMFLAFLYVKTGNLKITIALHMMINIVGGIVSKSLLELLAPILNMSDTGDIISYFMDHILGMLLYLLFGFFVIGMIIAGLVLLIVAAAKRRFALAPGQVVIPKGKRFRTVILNVGMILYCIFWIGMIVWELFK